MGRAAFARAATERGVDFDDFDDFDDEDDDAEHDDARAMETETETETETSEESGDVDVERAIGDDDARRRARGGWWTAFARDARAGRRRTPRARARGDVRERQAESVGERER